ncbi:MAG: DNA-binding protein [Candidatus Helarchaeota archaeon]
MDELEKIRRKKLLELQRKALLQKKMEEEKKRREQLEAELRSNPRERFIMTWMTPDAYNYLKQIRKQDQRVSNLIEDVLISLVNQGILRSKLTYQQLVLIERRITGRGPTIRIKRAGKEVRDITDELKEKFKS